MGWRGIALKQVVCPPPMWATVQVSLGVRCGSHRKEPAASSEQRGGPLGADGQGWSPTADTALHAVGGPRWRISKETTEAPIREGASNRTATKKALIPRYTCHLRRCLLPNPSFPEPDSPSYSKSIEMMVDSSKTVMLKQKMVSDTEPESVRNAKGKAWEVEARGFSCGEKLGKGVVETRSRCGSDRDIGGVLELNSHGALPISHYLPLRVQERKMGQRPRWLTLGGPGRGTPN